MHCLSPPTILGHRPPLTRIFINKREVEERENINSSKLEIIVCIACYIYIYIRVYIYSYSVKHEISCSALKLDEC